MDWIDKIKEERDNGIERSLDQSQHAAVNGRYPGTTIQYCDFCEEPTGRCSEDQIEDDEGNIYCVPCRDDLSDEQKDILCRHCTGN